jgi:hypothetical protein
MKTKLLTLLFFPLFGISQLHHRTGKNIGINLSGTMGTFDKSNLSSNLLSGASVGVHHMSSPGIYPMIGYTFSKLNYLEQRSPLTNLGSTHTVDASLLIDKRLVKFSNGVRVSNACHYLAIGLILAPEFHYFIDPLGNNPVPGEFTGLAGLSFTHKISRGLRSFEHTRQFDIFVRKGLTPYYSTTFAGEKQDFKRLEFGIRWRYTHHQMSSSVR